MILIVESLKNDITLKTINKMKSFAKSSKYNSLENLFAEVLFKEVETVQIETLKSFLKFKLDLDESETNRFVSHVKKFNSSSKELFTLKQITLCLKSENSFDLTNPFENNILSDFSKKKSYIEFDLSILYLNVGKVSDWIFKVAKLIENNHINLASKLNELDFDSDGIIR